MYFFYFLYKIPKNIYKDRSRTDLGTNLYMVLEPSNGPVQSSPDQKTSLLGPGPDQTDPSLGLAAHFLHDSSNPFLLYNHCNWHLILTIGKNEGWSIYYFLICWYLLCNNSTTWRFIVGHRVIWKVLK